MKLEIDLVPSTAWYSNLRTKIPRKEWDKIRKQSYSDSNHVCAICSVKSKLNCHEIWEYDDKKHIQTLKGFIALCDDCHMIKHIGFAGIQSSKGLLDFSKLVEHFKKVNDTYGHSIGDEIIKAVANTLRQGKRESDITGRIGGEEFAILLQETDLKTAGELIERLRIEVEQIVVNSNGTQVGITASFGVTELDKQCDTLEKVIVKADRALYQAKEEGRNRVVLI